MKHTDCIEVEHGGKCYYVPAVYQGQRIDNDRALELFMRGQIKPMSVEDSYSPAKEAPPAKARRY